MKKFINLSLGLSLVPFFALSSVNAQEPLNSAEGSPEIEEILVSASLIPIAANRSANAITIIDSEQIKLRAPSSIADLLRDVPGFAITCLASIIWLAFGYSIAFGDGGSFNAYFGNLDNILMGNITEGSMAGDIPESVFAMFQMTFAVITPALIVGAFAERMRFSAMLVFSGLWLVAVYAPITHWVWGGGWLGEMGLLDFAGGTVVHITAGVGALVAALVIGNRKGFPTQAMPPHNLTMTVTGAGMLWVGWFGFNGGSALAANGDAGMAILVTHISAATGSLAWMMM
ncbi:hypothetical protein N8957_02725, partial [Porticoccaceae bacterium]|nr:hypothetical protein [Porticoccaceae bacterium]